MAFPMELISPGFNHTLENLAGENFRQYYDPQSLAEPLRLHRDCCHCACEHNVHSPTGTDPIHQRPRRFEGASVGSETGIGITHGRHGARLGAGDSR